MTVEQASTFTRDRWTDYVQGSDGSNLGPPTKTAVGAPSELPEEFGPVTPLEYSMPNPNSRFGTHPAREVFASGFPNWHTKDLKNRITEPIDRTK